MSKEEHAMPKAQRTQRLVVAVLAAAVVAGALGFVLYLLLGVLGVPGAMYWAVGLAVAGSLLIRRMLFAGEQVGRAIVFALAGGLGALGGLWLGRALFG